MRLLAIESSCDESALAVVHDTGSRLVVEREVISSQIALHALYGGVVPELASREHLKNLPLLFDQLSQSHNLSSIDGIVVTTGPGLQGCLLMGTCFAEGVARALGKKLYGVNHIEGHLFAAWLENTEIQFPCITLVVSGGHTEIILVSKPGSYQILARSRDDAAGEAFDKSAYLLGFPYPGGRYLAEAADSVEHSPFVLPKVMQEGDAFSFSGLKTAIRLLVQKQDVENLQIRNELCSSVQAAIVEELVKKVLFQAQRLCCYEIVVTGGVAANSRLRRRLQAEESLQVHFPSTRYCTDNAAMIAAAALLRFRYGVPPSESLKVQPGWRIENGAA